MEIYWLLVMHPVRNPVYLLVLTCSILIGVHTLISFILNKEVRLGLILSIIFSGFVVYIMGGQRDFNGAVNLSLYRDPRIWVLITLSVVFILANFLL